jgi:membrane fusion protein (multidrug efflux system)
MADYDPREIHLLTSDIQQLEAAPKTPNRRARLLAGLGIALAALAGSYAALADTDHVSTDNAYVNADVAQVTPLVAGAIAAVEVVNTQPVKRGDVLLRLDDSDARLAVATAEAELARVRRQYTQATATSSALAAQARASDAEVARARAQMAVAGANFAKAKVDLERRRALAASGAVSGEELTAALNAYEAADANLALARAGIAQATAAGAAARRNLAASEALIVGSTIDDHPDVAAARSRLDQARLDLARTVVRAPLDGVVTNRQAQVGQRIAAGTQVMTIVPVASTYVDANFKEGQLSRVRVGQPVELVSDLYGSDVVFHGRVAGFSGGTGSAFALIPAQNATGNWIKVVQRLPVRVVLDPREVAAHPLRVGLSMEAEIDVSNQG